jgi:23S rRNA (adenine2503-C2)-methyltransferase
LGTSEFPPVETALVGGELAFRRHSGGHTTGPNWPTFLTWADRYIHGPALAQKRMTISTVGITHGLKKFVDNAHRLGLAISLHSADEEKRRKIIPAAEKNNLKDILALAKLYTEKTGRRVYFEYLLLGGLTDSIGDAKKLVKAIEGIPCKINLIRYNPVDGLPFKEPTEEDVNKFRDYLYPRTYAVMIRESRGADIRGACGQLAVISRKR